MFDRTKLFTLRNNPEHDIAMTAAALARGYPLGRPMTLRERLVVAVVSAEPTHMLTIDSKDRSRGPMARDFRKLVKRINRARSKPFIYVATLARSETGSGYHIHALLWEYLHVPWLGGHCKDLGLGWPHIDQIPEPGPGDPNTWGPVAYVLTQHGGAFGADQSRRHEPVPKGGRKLLYPQKKTLAGYSPELLSALEMAKDSCVPDETLCSRLPRFSSKVISL